eukprot:457063-Prymnesium_polylepis.3
MSFWDAPGVLTPPPLPVRSMWSGQDQDIKVLVSCEHVIHTSDACQRDLRWTIIATYSPTTPPAVHAIATGACLMMP